MSGHEAPAMLAAYLRTEGVAAALRDGMREAPLPSLFLPEAIDAASAATGFLMAASSMWRCAPSACSLAVAGVPWSCSSVVAGFCCAGA